MNNQWIMGLINCAHHCMHSNEISLENNNCNVNCCCTKLKNNHQRARVLANAMLKYCKTKNSRHENQGGQFKGYSVKTWGWGKTFTVFR